MIAARIASMFVSSIAVHIYDFSYIYSHSSLGRFIKIQRNKQLLVGLLAQLVEHCTGIVEVNWVEFFSDLISTISSVVLMAARILLLLQPQCTYMIFVNYTDTDEIPRFFLLLKNHIFIARSEDIIFIFHV